LKFVSVSFLVQFGDRAMQWVWRVLPVAFVVCGAEKSNVDHCTAMVVGPKASKDGASMVGQTNDAEGGPGSTVVFVPASDHLKGSVRSILDQDDGSRIGSLVQVPHTFAYTYATKGYGMMNEHKLAFGESTCSARIVASSLAHKGTALFSNAELSKISLERCKTARCAIKLMGSLAQNEGGFYGESDSVDTGGETLVVADPTEAWVFHILADPSGRSAIWAAQRVPDDHVAVVPNTFVIRSMDLASDDFMLSSNAMQIAKEFAWWDGKGEFDFSKAFSLGEYSNPHYSSRRLWRAFNLFAPSVELNASSEITDADGAYPFSVKPDHLLSTSDVFRVYRDYYEGTPFSLVSNTLAAGPFNSPLRVAADDAEKNFPTGAWERPISIYRTDYAVLNVCPPQGNGIVWFAPHTSHASVFTPIWSSAAEGIARPYVVDSTQPVDRASLFWAVSAVSNWAFGSMFSHAIVDIRAAQVEQEQRAHLLASTLATATDSSANQTELLRIHASEVHNAWWELFWMLMGKYSDGYVVTHGPSGDVTSTAVGYPSWWLESVNFKNSLPAADSSFTNLKTRMASAAKEMEDIDARRKKSMPKNKLVV